MSCFGPKNGANLHNSKSTLGFFFLKMLQNERGYGNFISCFSREKLIWGNLIYSPFRPFFTV